MAEKSANQSGKSSPYFDDNEEEQSGAGGKSGEVEFRYKDMYSGPTRDDLLAPSEIKRLLTVHKDVHKNTVEKQKQLRTERAALKEGKYVPSMEKKLSQGLGGGQGGMSKFKKHPISDRAQFSGIDKQVVGVPTLSETNTNDDLREALENRLENRYQNQPKFNPKPRAPGT